MLRFVLLSLVALGIACGSSPDTDRDGLPDRFEQTLLEKFVPNFYISPADCDVAPAEFHRAPSEPRVAARNGTIYGQVFPVLRGGAAGESIEIHYYHLWGQDCGTTGHPLDAESVSGLLRAHGGGWRAEFWYAAAHENTLCDMSNGAAAAALGALDRGPDVWVSRNKHASYLRKELCTRGCGDECDSAQPMRIAQLINVGEPGAPMNGAAWAASAAWPLASKMLPDYTAALIARMPAGNEAEIVPARDVPRGTRTTIKVAASTYGSLASANANTETAVAGGAHGAASGLGAASSATWRSLKRMFRVIVPEAPRQP